MNKILHKIAILYHSSLCWYGYTFHGGFFSDIWNRHIEKWKKLAQNE